MQAIAAAMFGGRSNDDGSALGGASGGGGGWDGATGSGMTYIHKLGGGLCQPRKLSGSIFAFASRPNQYRGVLTAKADEQKSFARFYPDRIARGDRGYRSA